MNKILLSISAMALMSGLSACGGSEESATNAVAENEMNAATDAGGPFADAEMRMNGAMMAAVGSDAGQSWAKKMIEHHQGAIDMSRIVLDQGASGDVAMMARETIEKQQKDMEDIRKLIREGTPNPQSAELYRSAMTDMKEKMMTAMGADASETYMRKMLEHHRGAVAMSDVALQNGVSGALREQIEKTRDDNRKDAEMVEAMLGGKSHQEAMAASGAKSAVQAKAEPAPAEKAKPTERAVPAAASKPAPPKPKPAEPKAADPNCLPEHRAAGHC